MSPLLSHVQHESFPGCIEHACAERCLDSLSAEEALLMAYHLAVVFIRTPCNTDRSLI